MKYRVVFRERTDAKGVPSEEPAEFLNAQLSDGVVLDASMVERGIPPALHTDSMEEDDGFLSLETEAWDYEIANDRQEEFVEALRNSEMVMEYETLGDDDSVSEV